MKSLIITLSLFATLPLHANSMEQVDHTQRQGIQLNLATDPQPTGVTHQHSEHNEPLFKPAKEPTSTSQETKKGLMGH